MYKGVSQQSSLLSDCERFRLFFAAGQAKVSHFDQRLVVGRIAVPSQQRCAGGGEQHIVWFDIAVDDASLMGSADASRYVAGDGQRTGFGELSMLAQPIADAAARKRTRAPNSRFCRRY